MLYGPFAPVNNVPVPLGLDQEIACIMRLIAEARARRATIAPTAAATEKFLARLGAAFRATVWVGGCKNWYNQSAAHTGPVALSAERAQGVLRQGAGRGFSVHRGRAGRLILVVRAYARALRSAIQDDT
jgi:hypothetical protein